jgi:hypothetical protein
VAFHHLPAEYEVRAARYAELVATDWTDSARHLLETNKIPDGQTAAPHKVRANWEMYRQKLRDLGAISNPVEMIEAWPLRPDGTDAISHLRARI